MQTTVASKEDIMNFFTAVIRQYELVLFPDVPFAEYEDESGRPKFPVDKAKAMDETMIACFDYCDENGLDIYALAGEAQVMVYKERGLLSRQFTNCPTQRWTIT